MEDLRGKCKICTRNLEENAGAIIDIEYEITHMKYHYELCEECCNEAMSFVTEKEND